MPTSMTSAEDDTLAEQLSGIHINDKEGQVKAEAVEGADASTSTGLMSRIDEMSMEISRLLNLIYEIQEIRHSASSNTTQSIKTTSLLFTLDTSITTLASRMKMMRADASGLNGDTVLGAAIGELLSEWSDLADQHAMLKEELRDDGWLVRFRATADQAETMMIPLQNSLLACTSYLDKIQSSTVTVPFQTGLEEEPSISGLEALVTSHDSMKRTYVPSIEKILKIMERSISERSTKNGETLRRFSTMSQQWDDMQRRLKRLDAKVRIVFAQSTPSDLSQEDVEVLSEAVTHDTPCPGDYFGSSKIEQKRPAGSSRSSYTSNYQSSTMSTLQRSPGPSSLSLGSTNPPSMQRRLSAASNTSAGLSRNNELLRWNGSHRVEDNATPRARRISNFANPDTARRSMASPTPSQRSTISGISHTGSRIPIPSPKNRSVASHIGVPALAVSTSHHQTFLSEANPSISQSHLTRAREAMKTPDPSRPGPRASMSEMRVPRSSMTPQLGARSVSGSLTPRTLPSMRGPPSSFRSNTPTPSGTSLGVSRLQRPSSRLSTKSYSNFNPAIVNPFQPSQFDLLDKIVQGILEEVGFKLFVGRVDASMKRGQRRGEGEEWKGEFVFAAGEKPVGVKLVILKPGGRDVGRKEDKIKCLARVGGAWVDLRGVLEGRMVEVLQGDESP